MATVLNDNIQSNTPKSLDNKYTKFTGSAIPYASIAEANLTINPAYRSVGLTVLIDDGGVNKEYWYQQNTTDGGLVIKGTSTALLTDGDYGDLTATGGGSTLTIDNGVVTLAKMADVTTGTLFYRKTAGAGAPELQTLATLKTDLGLTGTNSGDQTISLTGDVTGSGTGSFAASITNNSVTLAKLADMATASFLGRNTAGTGDPEVLPTATVRTMLSINNVENTALSTWTGSSNLTTLGTITTGIWSGSTITVNRGGTGATTLTGILIGNGTAAFTGLTGTANQLLRRNAGNTAYEFFTPAYLTANQSITLSGDVSGVGTTAITATIGTNTVTNSKLAQVPTATFKGRTTAATGNVEDLTATQATALLDTFTTALKGLAPASGGGTTNFLRADGTWAAPAGGGGGLANGWTETGNVGALLWEQSGTDLMELDSSGDLFTLGDVTPFHSFSDVRLKKNIREFSGSLQAVMDLRPVSYEWKEGRTATEIGFVAQEVEAIIPEVVRESKRLGSDELYKQVDYAHIVPVLVGAIQEMYKILKENKLI